MKSKDSKYKDKKYTGKGRNQQTQRSKQRQKHKVYQTTIASTDEESDNPEPMIHIQTVKLNINKSSVVEGTQQVKTELKIKKLKALLTVP